MQDVAPVVVIADGFTEDAVTNDALVDGGLDDGGTVASDAAVVASNDAPVDAASEDATVLSRCEETEGTLRCAHRTMILRTGATVLSDRDVHWQAPHGEAPVDGWPVVFLFQGSYLPAGDTWEAAPDAAFGVYHQLRTVQALLDAGYLVLAPEASGEGSTFWNTNIPPYATFWETSPDHALMEAIFAALAAGDFGPVNGDAYYATGISSGGYMTSRMAVSYPGRFVALAIAAASYATCGGATCFVPSTLPADHPPTLFLHGEVDMVVPIGTMERYEARLSAQGFTTRVVRDAGVGHAWLRVAPAEVLAWFAAE